MSNYWDQKDSDAFRDGFDEGDQIYPHEIAPAQRRVQMPKAEQPHPPQVDEPDDQIEEHLADQDLDEDDFTDVLSDARLRLEQGRLYELIMKHHIFEGVNADPRAIRNVQNEIRRYAKERMEIMLGMRSPEEKPAGRSSFNDLEVSVLKMLAKAASKGKTETESSPPRTGLAPLTPSTPKLQSMKPVSAPEPPKAKAQPPKQAPPTKPLKKSSPKPIARVPKDAKIERILAEEGVTREQLEEHYQPLGKDPSQMTEEERIDRNAQIGRRLKKQVKSAQALPQPSFEHQHMQYATQAQEVASNGAMSMILAAVSKKK